MKTTATTTAPAPAASPRTATNASPKRNKRKRSPSPRKKASTQPATKGRTNWAVGAAKEKLETAVREWDEQTGRAMDEATGQRLHLRDFSAKVSIPYNTFRKYVAHQADKRRTVGHSTGRRPLIGKEEQAKIAQELAEKGDGLLTHEAIDFVRERHPALSKDQAWRHFRRTLLKHHPEQLQVPPKRAYQPRQQQQQEPKSKAGIQNEEEETDDSEQEEEESAQSQPTREQALEAINVKIKRLRSELLDAELEKEKLLRTK